MIEMLLTEGTPGWKDPYPSDQYLGEIQASSFVTGTDLADTIGFSQGAAINNTVPWLQFIMDGKTLMIPKMCLRRSVTWTQMNSVDIISGNKTVVVQGKTYRVRLMTGAEANPSAWVTSMGQDTAQTVAMMNPSEWNRLILKMTVSRPIFARYAPAELGIGSGVTYGRMTICRERFSSGSLSPYAVGRGNTTATIFNYMDVTPSNGISITHYGWRPVLELVQ